MDSGKRQSERSGAPSCVSVEAYKRLYRALRTLSAGNRTLARAVDESSLAREMCNAIVDHGGYRHPLRESSSGAAPLDKCRKRMKHE